jgi:SET domain-containing protein
LVQEVQVFWTGLEKGWGIRALKDLPMGCFLFEFVGEILTTAEMEKQVVHALTIYEEPYIKNMVIGVDWNLEKEIDDSKALCLDGTFLGNVARYVNHRYWDATSSMYPSQLKMTHDTTITYIPYFPPFVH